MKSETYRKADFFDKMQFLLSFRYSKAECQNILNDYEEWFREESRNGKTDAEICSNMGRPKDIIKKITAETKSDVPRLSIFIRNCFVQFIFITAIRIFADLCAFYYCERNGQNYFFFALIINAVYFACAMAAVKGKGPVRLFRWENFTLTIFAAAVLAGNLMIWNFATDLRTGPYTVLALTTLVYVIYAATAIQGGWKVMKKEHEIYMFAIHATGLASMLFYAIRQYHIFTLDMEQFMRTYIYGSIGIYLEVFFFVILFWLYKGHTSRRIKWMRN